METIKIKEGEVIQCVCHNAECNLYFNDHAHSDDELYYFICNECVKNHKDADFMMACNYKYDSDMCEFVVYY